MKIIKEITDRCFDLNALACKISPATTIAELNHIRQEITSLRVMSRGFRIDETPVDMVEMTMNSKLFLAMYCAKQDSAVRIIDGVPVFSSLGKSSKPAHDSGSGIVIKYRMAE